MGGVIVAVVVVSGTQVRGVAAVQALLPAGSFPIQEAAGRVRACPGARYGPQKPC